MPLTASGTKLRVLFGILRRSPTPGRSLLLSRGTFGNRNVFQAVDGDFEHQVQEVQAAAKRALHKRYAWAFRRQPRVPTAYALPKCKKGSQSGRPIISVLCGCFHRPLLEARLLHRLCTIAVPLAFAKRDVYDLLARIRNFCQESSVEPLHCRNQDLSGFSRASPPLNSIRRGTSPVSSIANDMVWKWTPFSQWKGTTASPPHFQRQAQNSSYTTSSSLS